MYVEGGQPFGPHLPNHVSINHSQHTTNTRTLCRDWFYSRPIEAAETTMWVDLAPAWAIHNSTWGSRPVLTKLSLFDFCDRTSLDLCLGLNPGRWRRVDISSLRGIHRRLQDLVVLAIKVKDVLSRRNRPTFLGLISLLLLRLPFTQIT